MANEWKLDKPPGYTDSFMQPRLTKCYDCKTESNDLVEERRQVSGGDGVVYASDFLNVPVCANRRVCLANKAEKAAAQRYTRPCPVCKVDIEFVAATEEAVVRSHVDQHGLNEVRDALITATRSGWKHVR